MTSPTQEFFKRVLPWDAIADGGYCNLHWRSNRVGKNGKHFWGGKPTRTPEEMEREVNRAIASGRATDMYLCMSAQSKAETKTAANGRNFEVAYRSTATVVALSAFFIDIDVKPGAYATTKEALTALKQFMLDTGMPSPTAVVASGSGGVHVHWGTDSAFTREEWQPLANALARAIQEKGLHADTQCTVDSARILRVPGTLNHKSATPAAVKLLMLGDVVPAEAIAKALAPFRTAGTPNPGVSLPPKAGGAPDVNSELGAGVERRLIPLAEVANGCPFVKRTVETGGTGNDNALRMQTALLACFTTGGLADALAMTANRGTCPPEETKELYARVEVQKTSRNFGWPKCEKIASSGAPECVTCPLRTLGKSPLNFALTAAPVVTGNATLPPGYMRGADGLVYLHVVDPSGQATTQLVLPYPIDDPWLQDNPWVLHFTTVTTRGRRAKVEAPLDGITTRDGLAKSFSKQGLVLREQHLKFTREFLVAFIQQLQQQKDAVVSSSPFGWAVNHGKIEGFTYAGKVWMAQGERPAAAPDPIMQFQYTPKGDVAPWVAAARIITDQRRPALDAILAASFGAPLVRFTGQSGLMMNTYSPESGIGKTTTMRVAQAVWSDPIKSMQALNDTTNSVLKKIGEIRSLPLFWDELKTEYETQRFVTMSFQLTQGKEKSRLNSSSEFRDVGTWQTMLVSASNDSILDAVQRITKTTTAGIYRTFEYVVPPGVAGQIESGVVSRAVGALNDNYGHAGLAYAQFLGREHGRIASEVATLQDKLTKVTKAGNDERFWIAAVTVVMAGARYANVLGLTDIDERGLRDHLLDTLSKMRGEITNAPSDMKNQVSVTTILGQFLNAMRARHTLRTSKIHIGGGRPPRNSITVIGDGSKLDGIYVQHGRDDGLIRISSTYLSRWLDDHNYSRHALTKALKDEFGMKFVNGKLGSGTEYVCAMEYLLELDTNEPRLKNLIED